MQENTWPAHWARGLPRGKFHRLLVATLCRGCVYDQPERYCDVGMLRHESAGFRFRLVIPCLHRRKCHRGKHDRGSMPTLTVNMAILTSVSAIRVVNSGERAMETPFLCLKPLKTRQLRRAQRKVRGWIRGRRYTPFWHVLTCAGEGYRGFQRGRP